jgi:hypothetical protein
LFHGLAATNFPLDIVNPAQVRDFAKALALSGYQFAVTDKSHHRGYNRYWSQKVTHENNALELEAGIFMLEDPREISRSLEHSAELSDRRKCSPFCSAMSMLSSFKANRLGFDQIHRGDIRSTIGHKGAPTLAWRSPSLDDKKRISEIMPSG